MSFYVKKNSLKIVSIASLFAIFISFIPWEEIRNYEFVDLRRNIDKFNFPEYYYGYYVDFYSLKSFISDEPLWYFMNLNAKNMGFSADFFFIFLSFISLTIIGKYIIERSKYLYLLFLINPVSLDFFLSQQRNSLSFVLLLLLFFVFEKKYKYLLMLFLPLIHSLSALLALIFFASNLIKNKLHENFFLLNVVILNISLFLSFFLAYGRYFLAGYTDDNRFGEYEAEVHSLLYLFPWVMYLFWVTFFSFKKNINYILLVFFLSMYVFLTLFEFYAVRFLAMAIPFFIVNFFNIRFNKILMILFSIHQIILMWFWLKL